MAPKQHAQSDRYGEQSPNRPTLQPDGSTQMVVVATGTVTCVVVVWGAKENRILPSDVLAGCRRRDVWGKRRKPSLPLDRW